MLYLFILFVHAFPLISIENHQEENLSEKISAAAGQQERNTSFALQISADPLQLEVTTLLLLSPAFFLSQILLFPPSTQNCVSHVISLLVQTSLHN